MKKGAGLRHISHPKLGVVAHAYNSRTKGAYKTGAKVKLFYDEEAGCIVEKKASPMLIVMTVLFWLTALVGLISIIGG